MDFDLLYDCLHKPENVNEIPFEIYDSFMDYLIEEESWNDLFTITQVKSKVVYKNIYQLIDAAPTVFSPGWDLSECLIALSDLIENEDSLTDNQFINRLIPLECKLKGDFDLEPLIIKKTIDKRIEKYCIETKIDTTEYVGILNYKQIDFND